MSRISKYILRQFLSLGLDMDLLKNALIDVLIPLLLPLFAKFSLLSFSPFIFCNFYYLLPLSSLHLALLLCQFKKVAEGRGRRFVRNVGNSVRQIPLLTTWNATPSKQNIPSVIQTPCIGADVSISYSV